MYLRISLDWVERGHPMLHISRSSTVLRKLPVPVRPTNLGKSRARA